mgnify:CR=1 FL=1
MNQDLVGENFVALGIIKTQYVEFILQLLEIGRADQGRADSKEKANP